jgi:hypothetical protein
MFVPNSWMALVKRLIRPIRLPSVSVNQRLPSGPGRDAERRAGGGDAPRGLGDDAGGSNPT